MIKYYCDKCGKEIKGTRHKINIQQDIRPVDYLTSTSRDTIEEAIEALKKVTDTNVGKKEADE